MTRPKRPKRSAPIPFVCKSGKRAYSDRHRAVQAGHKAQQRHGEPFDVYRCDAIWKLGGNLPGCGQYHLTTRWKAASYREG